MLGSAPTIVRLSLHVTAAAVWVGGQLTLGGLVPTLRRAAPEATAAVARQFARLAWPAYVVLLGTGIWNVSATHPSQQTGAWKAVLSAKIAVVVLAGVAAFAHQRATGRRGIAIWGALAGLSSLSALVMGVALSG
jgi:putative copper export protein